jgi:hypothetical protein
MQKVEGSSPFIRLRKSPGNPGLFLSSDVSTPQSDAQGTACGYHLDPVAAGHLIPPCPNSSAATPRSRSNPSVSKAWIPANLAPPSSLSMRDEPVPQSSGSPRRALVSSRSCAKLLVLLRTISRTVGASFFRNANRRAGVMSVVVVTKAVGRVTTLRLMAISSAPRPLFLRLGSQGSRRSRQRRSGSR